MGLRKGKRAGGAVQGACAIPPSEETPLRWAVENKQGAYWAGKILLLHI